MGRWLLPAAGALAAVVAGATHADAAATAVTTTSGATSTVGDGQSLTWDVAGLDPTTDTCELDRSDGATTAAAAGVTCTSLGGSASQTSLAFTPTQAGTYTLVVTPNGQTTTPDAAMTSSPVAVHPAAPAPSGPASGIDPTPTWTFAVPPGASAACAVYPHGGSSPTPTPCTSPFTAPSLAGSAYGTYDVAVTVTDGGLDSAVGTASYLFTPPAPGVALTSPTAARASATSLSFALTDTAAGTGTHSFDCEMTGPGGYDDVIGSCASPVAVTLPSAAADGTYTLHVVETVDGVRSSAGSAAYTLDRTISPVSLTLSPTAGSSYTITGSASEPDSDGVTYACSVLELPTLAATSCGASTRFDMPAGTPDGTYTVKVVVTDSSGNSASDTAVYTLDRTGPTAAPTAVSSPSSPGKDTTPSWTLRQDEPGESFTCSGVSPGATAACTGTAVSLTISGGDGPYSVTVTPADVYGNTGPATTLSYTLDTTAPAVPAALGSAGQSGNSRSTTWTLTDADQGGDLDHYRCVVSTPAGGTADVTCDASTGQAALTIAAGSPDGTYLVDVFAVDAAGNESAPALALTYALDTTAPTASVTITPTSGTGRTVTASVVLPGDAATVTCAVTGPGPAAVSPTGCGTASVTFSIPTGDYDGTYQLAVTVADAVGNASSSSASYTLDQVPPTVAISGPGAGTGRTVDATATYGADPASVVCTVTGPDGALGVAGCGTAGVSFTIPASGSDGGYQVTVAVTDHAGNTASDTAIYTLQQSPPQITSTPASGTGRTVTFGVDLGADVVAVSCAVTGPHGETVSVSGCTVGSTSMSITIPTSGWDGGYTLTVTATDHLGSQLSDSATYTLLQSPPRFPSTPASSTSRTVSFGVDLGSDVATVACSVTGPHAETVAVSGCAAGSTSVTITIPASGWDGGYTLTVSVSDHLGAAAAAARTYTLLESPPTVTAPAAGTSRSATFPVDLGADVTGVTCSVTGPNGETVAISSCSVGTSGISITIPASGWDGGYTLTVTTTDHLGASAASSATYVLQQSAPQLSSIPPPGTTRTVGFGIDLGADVAGVSCAVLGPNGEAVVVSGCTVGSTSVTITIPASGWDGGYTLTVTATDHLGSQLSGSATYVLQQSAPQITSTPPSGTGRTAGFGVALGSDVAAVACTVTGPHGESVAVAGCQPGSTTVSITIPATGWDGDYTLTIRVYDHLDDHQSVTTTYTLLQSPPQITSAPAPGTARTVSFGVALGADAAGVSCTVDAPHGEVVAVSGCSTGSASVSITLPASGWDGDYVLHVTVTDHLGSALSTQGTYTLQQSAPQITSTPPPGTARTVGFGVSFGVDVVGVSCAVTGPHAETVVVSGCTVGSTSVSIAIPATGWDGGYTLTVTATDHLGSRLSDSAVYTLQQSAPQITSTPAPGTGRTVSFGVDLGVDVADVACAVAGPHGESVAIAGCAAGSSAVTITVPASGWDGGYTLTVTVTDHLGSQLSDSATYVLQQSPPRVTSTPTSSPDRAATFGVALGVDVAGVSCAVAGPHGEVVAVSGCVVGSTSVTITVPAIGWDGGYTLTVTATDHLGSQLSDSATYVLQQSAPRITAVPAPSTDRAVSFTVDLGADAASVTCTVTGPHGESVTVGGCAAGSSSVSITIPASGWDGDYRLDLTVFDHLGSQIGTSGVYPLLQSAPQITPTPAPGTARTVGFGVDLGADVASVSCAVTGPNGETVALSGCGVGSTSVTITIPTSGWDGGYTLTVTATDHLGSQLSDSATYVLEQSAPQITGTPASSTGHTVSFAVDLGADVAGVACAVTGPHGEVVAIGGCAVGSPSVTITIPTSGWDGGYTLTVTATDHLGSQLSDSATYVLQLAAPVVAPLGTGSSRTVAVTIDPGPDVTGLSCAVTGRNGVTFTPGTCAPTMTFTIPVSGWDGDYVLTVTTTDHLGATRSASATYTLTPSAPFAVASPSSPGSSRSPQWDIADAVVDLAGYRCTSAVQVSACGSVVRLDLTGLVDGTYAVVVQAVDSLGAVGDPQTFSYTLIPPAPTAMSPPTSPASARTPQWTLSDGAVDATGYLCSAVGPGGVAAPCTTTPTGVGLDLAGLVDGTYVLTVRAVDSLGAAGDPATLAYTLIPPAPFVTAAPTTPGSSRSPQWAIGDGVVDLTGYRCASSVPVLACGAVVQLDLSGRVDGTYTVVVRAVDALGVAGDPTTLSFTMVPPAPTVTSTPVSPSSARAPQWTVRDGVVDLAGYRCTSSVPVTSCGSTVRLDLTGVLDGTYTVTVQAVDALGTAGDPTAISFTLIPPAPIALTAPPAQSAQRVVSWTLVDGAVDAVSYVCGATGPGGVVAPATCGSGNAVTIDLTGLPDGVYTVTARAVDQLGAAGDAATFSYQLVPPPPTATSSPASPLNSRAPSWGLTDAVAGVTYSCSAIGPSAVAATCSGSTVTLDLSAAADGVYTVFVVAADSAGGVSDANNPLTLTYQLDTSAPAAPIVSVTPSPSQGRTATYTIAGVEPLGTVACSFAAPVGSTVMMPAACAGGGTVVLAGQPDGAYTLTVTVTDVAGNVSAPTVATYVLDTTPPAAPVVKMPDTGNDVTPTPTSVVIEPGATLTCRIERYFLLIKTMACGTDGTVDLTGQDDGEFEITMWQTDRAGNVGPTTSVTYLLDTVPPAAPTLVAPASPSPIENPQWRWTSGEPDTWASCSITSAGAVVVQPAPCADAFTADFSALPDGAYLFSVVLHDAAGNLSPPATSTFILDRTAPVPPTVVPPRSPGSSTTPRWLITAPKGATLTCTLTRGGTVVLGPGACPSRGQVSLDGMPDGTYTMRVTATDNAGNVSAGSVTTYVLDTAPPAQPTLTYGSGNAGSDRSPFWGFVLPPGTTGRCELLRDGDVLAVKANCRGAVSFTLNGADGTYTVRIVAVDAAGNVSHAVTATYQLVGHGGGGGTVVVPPPDGAGGPPSKPHRPRPQSPSAVQQVIEQLSGAADAARNSVKRAAGAVERAALPNLPVLRDPLTKDVSHAVQHVINAVSTAGGGTGFPLLLLVVVGMFLLAQSRIDRRDPKLALASVAADDDLGFDPPPSRGGDR